MLRAYLFHSIARQFGVKHGDTIPVWMITLRHILFPLECYMLDNPHLNYDESRDMFLLYGFEYKPDFFRKVSHLKKGYGMLIYKSDEGITISAVVDLQKEIDASTT